MRLLEDMPRASAEDQRITLMPDAEASDRDTVDAVDNGRQLVLPGDIVERTRGEHLDFSVAAEVLGDVARMQLGAPIDGPAVALGNDGEFHCSPVGSEPPDGSWSDVVVAEDSPVGSESPADDSRSLPSSAWPPSHAARSASATRARTSIA